MKNAEKYIDGIALSMIENIVCYAFVPDHEKYDAVELCMHCCLKGKCCDIEALKHWLNQEVEDC